MIVSAREFTSAAEMRAAAVAVHAKLMNPTHKVVVRPPAPVPPAKVIRFTAQNLPEWKRRRTEFDAHVLASRPILELIRSGQIEVAPAGRKTIAKVVEEVLACFPGITLAELKSSRRKRAVCAPRAIAMWEAKMQTGKSYPEIGRWFGGRDHTTVLHSVKKIDRLIVDGCIEVNGIIYRMRGQA